MRGGRLARWQASTAGLLVLGYSGYYLCRSNLSVAMPLIAADLASRGVGDRDAGLGLGAVASLGTLAYAAGKFVGGSLADFLGGRRTFLLGMAGSVLFTLAFAAGGGLPAFTLAWAGNRLIQAPGWPGLVKVASRWFSHASYGTAMGVLSLSFLFGDAIARLFMGALIEGGLGWRGVFLVAAGALALILVANVALLRDSPGALGLGEPESSPESVFGAEGSDPSPPALAGLLGPLLRSPAFWLVCLLSLGFTLVRETFNTWTPTYLVEGVGLGPASAARTSALFPLFGGASVLASGYLGDRLGRGGRAGIILLGLVLGGALLAMLGLIDFGGRAWAPVALVSGVAFLIVGPYSYLAGAIALDLGGKRGAATASGFIDGFGYVGGVLAGSGAARVAASFGWAGVFVALAAVAWASALVAALYLARQVGPLAAGPAPAGVAP